MKKWIWMILAPALLLTSACSSGPAADGKSGETAKPQSPVEDNSPAELVFYSVTRDSEEAFNERYGDAVRKKFPHYTIKYIQRVPQSTDLEQLIASNQRIDIIWDSRASFPGSTVGHDLQFDMTELLKKHEVDVSRFEQSQVNYMKKLGNGAIYGLPLENSTNVIYYNKDLFDKFGVDYPQDGITWEELQKLSNQLNVESDGEVYTGYIRGINSLVNQNSFSLPTVDPATKRSSYGDPTWKKIIETELSSMLKNPVAQKAMQQYNKGKFLGLNHFYKEKVVAMYVGGPLVPILYGKEMSQMNWDMVALPTYSEKPGVGSQAYPIYIGMTNQAANKDAAMKVIKYLVSDEFQLQHSQKGNMTSLVNPDITKAMGSESQFKGKNYGAFFYNKFAEIVQEPDVSTGDVQPMYKLTDKLLPIVNGSIDINSALRTAEEEVNKAIDAAAKK